MPTYLPRRNPVPRREYEVSPLLVLVVAALAIGVVLMEAEILSGSPDFVSGSVLPSYQRTSPGGKL